MFENSSQCDRSQFGCNLRDQICGKCAGSGWRQTRGNCLQDREAEDALTLAVEGCVLVDGVGESGGEDGDKEEARDLDQLDREPATAPSIDRKTDREQDEHGDESKDEIEPGEGLDGLEHSDDDGVDGRTVVDASYSEPLGDLLDNNRNSRTGGVADQDSGREEIKNNTEAENAEEHGKDTDDKTGHGSNFRRGHLSGEVSNQFSSDERDDGSGSDGQILRGSHEAIKDGTDVSRVEAVLDRKTGDLGIGHSLGDHNQADCDARNDVPDCPSTLISWQPDRFFLFASIER